MIPFHFYEHDLGGGKGYIQSTSKYWNKYKMGKLHLDAKVRIEFLFGLSDNGSRALPIHVPKDLIMTQFMA